MRGTLVTWEGGRKAGKVLTTLVDFPGYYAIFFVEEVETRVTYVLNSRDVSVL